MNRLNQIISSIKRTYAAIVVFSQLKWDGIRLDFAIYMADTLQRAKNKRFYVVENAAGKLVWLCNDDIKAMKKPHRVKKYIGGRFRTFKFRMMQKDVDHLQIMNDCLYYTPLSRNNSNGITVEERNKKRASWIAYLEKRRMDRIFGKLKLEKR